MGKQLNTVPSALNNIWLLQSVQWDIIEYQVYNTDDVNILESTPTLYSTRLASPTYINQISNRYIQNNTQNNESQKSYNINGYYAFILFNKINILTDINLKYYNSEDLTKFIGPTETLEQLINILQQYATAHNVKLRYVSEKQYELI